MLISSEICQIAKPGGGGGGGGGGGIKGSEEPPNVHEYMTYYMSQREIWRAIS